MEHKLEIRSDDSELSGLSAVRWINPVGPDCLAGAAGRGCEQA
jgi:hypothetical protein